MFFKRLSRGSRSNSYVDDGYDSPNSPSGPKSAFDRYLDNNAAAGNNSRPQSRRLSQGQHNVHSSELLEQQQQSDQQQQISPPVSAGHDGAMYSRGQPDVYAPQTSHSRAVSGSIPNDGNGMSHSALPDRTMDKMGSMRQTSAQFEPVNAPDMLTQAFNMAVRPYQDIIESKEAEVQELRDYVATLENERRDIHAWIDKRGLRPGAFHTPLRYTPNHANSANRCPTKHSSRHGYRLKQLIQSRPSCLNPLRPTRPQNHNRKLRPAPPTRRPQRLNLHLTLRLVDAQVPARNQQTL